MASKENQPPPTFGVPLLPRNSPSTKPALIQQRDHSACRRPETPLKVRKTRENLKQCSIYADIPPPCFHGLLHGDGHESNIAPATFQQNRIVQSNGSPDHDEFRQDVSTHSSVAPAPLPKETLPSEHGLQRQKSARRRMLSRVKQGLANRSKNFQPLRPGEAETSVIRRFSGRRRKDGGAGDQRSQSFEISRDSIDSELDDSFVSISVVPLEVRSFTGSTVSTADVLGESSLTVDPLCQADGLDDGGAEALPHVFDLPRISPSPSPQQTPRPPRSRIPTLPLESSSTRTLTIPCVSLDVVQDCAAMDVNVKREIWVAITATVQTSQSDLVLKAEHSSPDPPHRCTQTHGEITTLRICFKPVNGSRIDHVVGRRSVKNVAVGEKLSLFVKLHVPRVRVKEDTSEPDQDSLFTELESIVGTLETEVLHVEARYRHSMLPSDNVVTVRHVCKMNRPKSESRWSMPALPDGLPVSANAQVRLAEYLAAEYNMTQALQCMHEYLEPSALGLPEVHNIRESLKDGVRCQDSRTSDEKPSVIITDMDCNANASADPVIQALPIATATSVSNYSSASSSPASSLISHQRNPSLTCLHTLAPPLLTAARTTTALSTTVPPQSQAQSSDPTSPEESQDSARKLWQHIRHTSLSAKQLGELTNSPEYIQHLEAGDESLRELRRRALANKRSVGVETLKGWKWEDSMMGYAGEGGGRGEAPWM